jgi:predicted deacetylase
MEKKSALNIASDRTTQERVRALARAGALRDEFEPLAHAARIQLRGARRALADGGLPREGFDGGGRVRRAREAR